MPHIIIITIFIKVKLHEGNLLHLHSAFTNGKCSHHPIFIMWQANREQLRKHQSCDKNGIFIFLKILQFPNCFYARQIVNPITSKFSMKENSNHNKPKIVSQVSYWQILFQQKSKCFIWLQLYFNIEYKIEILFKQESLLQGRITFIRKK